jgi:putative transposase
MGKGLKPLVGKTCQYLSNVKSAIDGVRREKLEATKVKHRQRKLDWKALSKDVQENPEARLRDRAEKFGVRPSAICYALKKMKVTRKKKELRYRERNREERIKYYRVLRELIKIY